MQEDLHRGVSLELRQHLYHVEQHENYELRRVDQIPEVFEVIQSLFLELDQFEKDEEDLCEEAKGVGHIEDYYVARREGHDERHHESTNVEFEHELQEGFGPYKLEVNQLPDGLQVIETNVGFILKVEDTSQVLIVEVDCPEAVLLHVPDLFTNNDLLEVNQ